MTKIPMCPSPPWEFEDHSKCPTINLHRRVGNERVGDHPMGLKVPKACAWSKSHKGAGARRNLAKPGGVGVLARVQLLANVI